MALVSRKRDQQEADRDAGVVRNTPFSQFAEFDAQQTSFGGARSGRVRSRQPILPQSTPRPPDGSSGSGPLLFSSGKKRPDFGVPRGMFKNPRRMFVDSPRSPFHAG